MSKITIKEIAHRHPTNVYSATNRDYADVANGVLAVLKSTCYWKGWDEDEQEELAIKLTMYFEDIVSEIGLWRSFVEKHSELYGKPLPFYDVAENYAPDRLHSEDIQLLMWDFVHEVEDSETIVDPMDLRLADSAVSVYNYLDGLFEDTSINDELYCFFHEAKFASHFYRIRDVFYWYFTTCYLTSGRFMQTIIDKEQSELEGYSDCDAVSVVSTIMADVASYYPVGPLALLPKEWLAMLMRVHGQEAVAADIEAIDLRDIQPYMIEHYDKRQITMRTVDDVVFSVERTPYFAVKDRMLRDQRVNGCIGNYAVYRGEWFLNGLCVWNDMTHFVEEVKERRRKSNTPAMPNYDKFAAKASDKGADGLLFFFRTYEELVCFFNREIVDNKGLLPINPDDYGDGFMLYVPQRDKSDYIVMQGNTLLFKHPDNPMYSEYAGRDAGILVGDIEGLPGEFCRYVIRHDLVPDLAFDSIDGYESGRRLLQDNLDFVARTLRRHYY